MRLSAAGPRAARGRPDHDRAGPARAGQPGSHGRPAAPAARGRVLGRVSARAEAGTPLWRPGEIRMTVPNTRDELVVAGGRWTTRSPAIIRWESRRLSVDRFRAKGRPGTIAATAGMEAGGKAMPIMVRAGAGATAAAAGPGHPGRGAGGSAARRPGWKPCRSTAAGRWERYPWTAACRSKGRSRSARRSWATGPRWRGPSARIGCRQGDRLRRRERAMAEACRQRTDQGNRPHERGGHPRRGPGPVPAHALGDPDCRRPRPSSGRIHSRSRAKRAGQRRKARARNAEGPGPDGGRLADRGAPRRLPDGRRADRGNRRVHPRSRRGRAGGGSWQWSGGGRLEARLGPVGLAELRAAPGPRPRRLGMGRLEAVFPGLSRTSPPRWRSYSTESASRVRRSAPGPWRADSEGGQGAPSSAFPSVGSAPLPRGVPRQAAR